MAVCSSLRESSKSTKALAPTRDGLSGSELASLSPLGRRNAALAGFTMVWTYKEIARTHKEVSPANRSEAVWTYKETRTDLQGRSRRYPRVRALASTRFTGLAANPWRRFWAYVSRLIPVASRDWSDAGVRRGSDGGTGLIRKSRMDLQGSRTDLQGNWYGPIRKSHGLARKFVWTYKEIVRTYKEVSAVKVPQNRVFEIKNHGSLLLKDLLSVVCCTQTRENG